MVVVLVLLPTSRVLQCRVEDGLAVDMFINVIVCRLGPCFDDGLEEGLLDVLGHLVEVIPEPVDASLDHPGNDLVAFRPLRLRAWLLASDARGVGSSAVLPIAVIRSSACRRQRRSGSSSGAPSSISMRVLRGFEFTAARPSCGHGGRGIGPFPLAQANARLQYSVTSQLSGLTSWTVSLSRSAMGTIRRQPKTRNPPRMTLRDPSTSPRVLPSPSTISEVEIAEAPPRIGELRAVAAGSVPVLGAPGPGSPPDGDVVVAGP